MNDVKIQDAMKYSLMSADTDKPGSRAREPVGTSGTLASPAEVHADVLELNNGCIGVSFSKHSELHG